MAKPIETVSVPSAKGAFINASVWENEVDQDGQKYKTYSVSIEKRYQKDGTWNTASAFNANELLVVAYIANKTYELALQLRSQQYAVEN
ncbi:MAG: hypothetical protein R3C53_14270 [Pirellulaceae bacterium]